MFGTLNEERHIEAAGLIDAAVLLSCPDLRAPVPPRLPPKSYSSQATWETDVTEVVAWVKYGLLYLDPYATILGVEQFLDRTFHPDGGSPPIPLRVVIDMLLLRTDSQGAQFIEIIDYKTRKHLDGSPFAPVHSRFVLKRLINTDLPGESFAPVIFPELYLGKRLVRKNEMTLKRCLADWEEVKRTLTGLAAEISWVPTPSPLCEWCQFNGNGCEPTREEENLSLW